MKEKILSVMKPLYASKGFKTEELEGIAELLAGNLGADATEDDIKAKVDGFTPFADLLQKVGNRYASGVESKYKGWKSKEEVDNELEQARKDAVEQYLKLNPKPIEIPKPKEEPKPQPQQTEEPKQEPQPQFNFNEAINEAFKAMQTQQTEYQSALQKQMAELIAKNVNDALRPYKEKTEREYLSNLLNSNEKVKGMPETFRRSYTLDKEENLDEVVGRMEVDYARLKQELLNSGEFATPPAKGDELNDEDDVVNFLNGIGASQK